MRSYIVSGILSHQRYGTSSNSFAFKHTMLMLNTDQLEAGKKLCSLISIEKTGLLSIRFKNLIDETDKPIKEKILRLFEIEGNQSKSSSFFAVTTPTVLGYSFNPASFYFVVSGEGNIENCAVEVHNTFNESHVYILNAPVTSSPKSSKYTHEKRFHVSPFIGREGNYEFEFELTSTYLKIGIVLLQKNHPVISTGYLGELIPITKKTLFLNAGQLIFTVLLTEFRILKQAYKLYFRQKLPFFRKPTPLPTTKTALSRGFISKLKFPFI
ncbi:DUF1365 domain-containing protein [Chloroflexi bacterium]|nr:DUF1365 domain-containing protein [Chloroflexota bacterium]